MPRVAPSWAGPLRQDGRLRVLECWLAQGRAADQQQQQAGCRRACAGHAGWRVGQLLRPSVAALAAQASVLPFHLHMKQAAAWPNVQAGTCMLTGLSGSAASSPCCSDEKSTIGQLTHQPLQEGVIDKVSTVVHKLAVQLARERLRVACRRGERFRAHKAPGDSRQGHGPARLARQWEARPGLPLSLQACTASASAAPCCAGRPFSASHLSSAQLCMQPCMHGPSSQRRPVHAQPPCCHPYCPRLFARCHRHRLTVLVRASGLSLFQPGHEGLAEVRSDLGGQRGLYATQDIPAGVQPLLRCTGELLTGSHPSAIAGEQILLVPGAEALAHVEVGRAASGKLLAAHHRPQRLACSPQNTRRSMQPILCEPGAPASQCRSSRRRWQGASGLLLSQLCS